MGYYVYRITNNRPESSRFGHFYVGVHNGRKINYMGSGVEIRKAIKKHGRESFIKDILVDGLEREVAYIIEKEIVTEGFIKQPNTYNNSTGGSSPIPPSRKGVKLTEIQKQTFRGWHHREEAKLKISQTHLGRKRSHETCAAISKALMGKKLSKEHIEKIRVSHLGSKQSPETREKHKQAALKWRAAQRVSQNGR